MGVRTCSGAIDLRDAWAQWGLWPPFRSRDEGGYLYMADGRCIYRWPAETGEHAIARNGQDWRPALIRQKER